MTAWQDTIQLQSRGECCSNARASMRIAKKCRDANSRSRFRRKKRRSRFNKTALRAALTGFNRLARCDMIAGRAAEPLYSRNEADSDGDIRQHDSRHRREDLRGQGGTAGLAEARTRQSPWSRYRRHWNRQDCLATGDG